MVEGRAAAYVGTAGWSVPRASAGHFPIDGSHLERYAQVFKGVEINSSFYRPHRPSTYARWAASVPGDFRFSVKLPKTITHELRLKAAARPLGKFLGEVQALGGKLGPLLIQLPPSFAFDEKLAGRFLALLRRHHPGLAACEPRHLSWFAPAASALLTQYRVARVAADPPLLPAAAKPGGWKGLVYFRLHGSPRMYWSAYPENYLRELAAKISRVPRGHAWCVFDNTAAGAATENGWDLQTLLLRNF